MKYAIFIHDPDGDSGDGCITGPFKSAEAATRKMESILSVAPRHANATYEGGIECIVLPVIGISTSAREIVAHVLDQS